MQKKLFSRSDRVKGVDFHPTEPWLLTGLYNGTVNIYNHETGAIVKTFEVAEVPVRCVKFIARKNWFVAGSDDFQLRVFNYNTHEKVTAFEAHPDYIRCLTVHPTASIVLTGSDDMTIKAWDWDKAWKNIQVSAWTDFSITKVCLLNFMNRHTKAIRTISWILPSTQKTLTPSCPHASTAQSKCGPSVLPPPISQWKHTIKELTM